MNKRQKKKKEKKLAWDVGYNIQEQKRLDRELDYNGEGYRDTTAGAAIRRAEKGKL